jgi:hypothetical protein
MNHKPALPIPTESEEQQCLFRWATFQSGKYPELDLLYHVPNGGKRGKAEAGRFKAEGVKSGVPDICLPVPRGGYHGLYVELKRRKSGKMSPAQDRWIIELVKQGYHTAICNGWEEAAQVILEYLKMGRR